MTILPKGWTEVALGDVAVVDRSTVTAAEIVSGTLYVGLEDIEAGGTEVRAHPVEPGQLGSNKFRFDRSHILYGKLRPYLAKIAAAPVEGICSTDILPVRPTKVDQRYLLHFLRQPVMVDHATARSSGANLPRLAPKELERFSIPLPPLEEQRRIAAILDKADQLRSTRCAALRHLQALFGSLFRASFGGLPGEWPLQPLSELISDSRLGLVRGSALLGEQHPYPYIRMNSIGVDGSLDLSDLRRTSASPEELTSHALRSGDLLFNTRNTRELVGKTAIFLGDQPMLYNNNLMRLRFHAVLEPDFVASAFRDAWVKQQLEKRKSGTTSVCAIYAKDLFTVELPVPPKELQKEYGAKVAMLRRSFANTHRFADEFDALLRSLQSRAFRGEL